MKFASQRAAFVPLAATGVVKGTGSGEGTCGVGGGTYCEMFGCVARYLPRAAQVICASAGVAKRLVPRAIANKLVRFSMTASLLFVRAGDRPFDCGNVRHRGVGSGKQRRKRDGRNKSACSRNAAQDRETHVTSSFFFKCLRDCCSAPDDAM